MRSPSGGPVQPASGSRAGIRLCAAALWLGAAYFWLLPLVRPRGAYLCGHYQLRDVYLGLPVGLAALATAILVFAAPTARRSLALRLATAWFATVFALFAVDALYTLGYARAWQANYWFDEMGITRKDHDPDPELGYVRKPHLHWRGRPPGVTRLIDYRTDARGFRNPPDLTQADLVFIGDSFTEAGQVEEDEAFPARVATLTGHRTANLGRGGYGPQQELAVLRRYALAYRPRVIVWQLFEGNDLRDAEEYHTWREGRWRPSRSLKNRYLDNSLLNRLLALTMPPALEDPHRAPALLHHPGDGAERQRVFYRYDPSAPAHLAVGMAETERALEEGWRFCERNHVQLVVLLVPVMVRVLAPELEFDSRWDRARYLPFEGLPQHGDFNDRVTRLCSHLGCPVVDPLSPLKSRAAVDNRALFIANDEHFDRGGHQVVALTIAETLRAGW